VSFRDRFFTRRTAEAITSPSGIILAGAGISAGILAGVPLIGVGLGALLWGGRVLVGMPRGPKEQRVDAGSLQEPWRTFVREAQQAKNRFDHAVATADAGPLRDRLSEIGTRIEAGVHECWKVARRGNVLTDARRQIDVPRIQAELASTQANASAPWAAGSSIQDRVQALENQLGSAERMDRVIFDTQNRLQTLDARLDEAVTRAIELSVQAGDAGSLGGLDSDVDSLVEEMEALRLALDEASGRAPDALPTLPPTDTDDASTAADADPGQGTTSTT
jgi:hypothetical protein